MAVILAGTLSLSFCPSPCSTSVLTLAARRRKVRCSEQRPRCSHCERLNLDCTWNRASTRRGNATLTRRKSPIDLQAGRIDSGHLSSLSPPRGSGSTNFNSVFDSTWDEAMLLTPSAWPDYSIAAPLPQELLPSSAVGMSWDTPTSSSLPQIAQASGNSTVRIRRSPHSSGFTSNSTVSMLLPFGENSDTISSDDLLDLFLQVLIPPILAPVEIGPKLPTTKTFLALLSSESSMVRRAIMAFSAIQLSSSQSGLAIDYESLYNEASRELHSALENKETDGNQKGELKHFLAAIFLLTYVDVGHAPEIP